MKFEVGDDFSKILFGDDISREIVPRGRFLRRNRHLAVWGRFLQGMISPAFKLLYKGIKVRLFSQVLGFPQILLFLYCRQILSIIFIVHNFLQDVYCVRE